MSNQLLTLLFWILALSCKAPVPSYQNHKVALIAAEKSAWSGGRPGIKGMIYTVALKAGNSKDRIRVKALRAEGNSISFRQTVSGNTVSIKGNFQTTDENSHFEYPASGAPVEKSVRLNPQDNWIEYTVNDAEKRYRIVIPGFTPVEPEGELIPRRP